MCQVQKYRHMNCAYRKIIAPIHHMYVNTSWTQEGVADKIACLCEILAIVCCGGQYHNGVRLQRWWLFGNSFSVRSQIYSWGPICGSLVSSRVEHKNELNGCSRGFSCTSQIISCRRLVYVRRSCDERPALSPPNCTHPKTSRMLGECSCVYAGMCRCTT